MWYRMYRMNEELEKKQAILNSLISTVELISTSNHKRATLAEMKCVMYRGKIVNAWIWNIDDLAYEIMEWVNVFLENNI